MARSHPDVALMRELRTSLGPLRLDDLAVGSDGRNRTGLRPFASKTGRNQPSNSRFIFGPSCWLRGLIKPGPGRAIAYVDWGQQEFGIAAALSGDVAMMDAYRSGDAYLAFGKRAGRIPPLATTQTHRAERGRFKACALGVLYGMGADGLARRIDWPTATGREMLRLSPRGLPVVLEMVRRDGTRGDLAGSLQTVFGWTLRVGPDVNPRSLRNFPCQANGAEMLRLACCLATERGVFVVAPVHDALLIEGPARSIDEIVRATQEAMSEASEIVLDGFRLRSEAASCDGPIATWTIAGCIWARVMGLLPGVAEASLLRPFPASKGGPKVGWSQPALFDAVRP